MFSPLFHLKGKKLFIIHFICVHTFSKYRWKKKFFFSPNFFFLSILFFGRLLLHSVQGERERERGGKADGGELMYALANIIIFGKSFKTMNGITEKKSSQKWRVKIFIKWNFLFIFDRVFETVDGKKFN